MSSLYVYSFQLRFLKSFVVRQCVCAAKSQVVAIRRVVSLHDKKMTVRFGREAQKREKGMQRLCNTLAFVLVILALRVLC